MKQFILLLFSLYVCFPCQLPAQNCQAIIAEIIMTDPPVSPSDTGYIDVCVGDTVNFSASAIFPENDLFYHQDVDSSTFRWFFGDGLQAYGPTVNHAFDSPGGYKVNLIIIDQEGCSSENSINIRVRVGGISGVTFDPGDDLIVCQDDTISIQANYENPNTFEFKSIFESRAVVPLPDGTGAVYTTDFAITAFPPGSVVSNSSQLLSVCVTIEHSWMHDLEIRLLCPDGTELLLQNQEFLSPEVFLGIPYELDDVNTSIPPTPGVGYTYCWTPDATNGTWTEFSQTLPNNSTLPEGNYNSFESFDLLLGCPLNGIWQLSVSDQWGSDNGYVFGWSLQFEASLETEPPFSIDVVDYNWEVGAGSTIISETNESIEANIADSSGVNFTLTNAWGCSESFAIETEIVADSLNSCQPCSTLIADAGPDILLNCVSPQVSLNCGNSTMGEYFQHSWFDEAGNLLGTDCNINVNLPGLYILEVQSLTSGCIVTDTLEIILDDAYPVADAGTTGYLSCSTQSVQLGGPNTTTSTDMTFTWSLNGNIISNELAPVVDQTGLYLLEVNNIVNGCTAMDTVRVTDQLLLNFEINPTSCEIANGSAMVTISPAIQDPQVQWSTGESGLQIENLAQGWYSVTINDNDCIVQENFYVDQDLSCKVQISGYVYNDHSNQDCIADNVLAGEECVLLHLMPLDIYTYSDPTGYYDFVVDPGNYTIEILPQAYFELICPASPAFTIDLPAFGSISHGHNFYLKYAPNSYDLRTSHYVSAARPGFSLMINSQVCNSGESAVDATISLRVDSLLTDFVTIPMYDAFDASTNTLTWLIPALQPGACLDFEITTTVPTSVNLGTVLDYSSSVGPVDLDVNPTNNNKEWSQVVVGAYDPNDKQILTGDNQFGGEIFRQDSVLQYQLRFQNVGTAPAQTVVIRDTLDTNLDVTTIQAGLSSHDYVLEFEGHNVLIFRFDNINLPDSTSNEPESQGYVIFSIELKDELPFGTKIENSAAIFFDFNAPVITNTVINTLTKPQFAISTEVQICEGDEYEGITYFESTTLVDTLDFIDFDSVYITDIGVSPVYETTIDTILLADQPYEGIVYENDTTLLQNFLSIEGCDSLVIVNIVVETVGTRESLANQIELQLHPNPVKEMVQIQYRLPASEVVSAHFYDVFGQKVHTVFSNQVQAATLQQLEISLAELPAGLYLFAIENGVDRYVKKFVKVE